MLHDRMTNLLSVEASVIDQPIGVDENYDYEAESEIPTDLARMLQEVGDGEGEGEGEQHNNGLPLATALPTPAPPISATTPARRGSVFLAPLSAAKPTRSVFLAPLSAAKP